MSRNIHIALTAAAIASTTMFVTDDVEARGFGGFSRGSFARSNFSAPRFHAAPQRSFAPRIAPRSNFVASKPVVRSIKPQPKPVVAQQPVTRKITVPTKVVQLPKPISPIGQKPIKPFDPGRLAGGGLQPVIPPHAAPPTLIKLPPKVPTLPPRQGPIDPGGNGAPPPKPGNPGGGTNPPATGMYPPPPAFFAAGTVIGLVGATIGGNDEPAATVQVDCSGYFRKWEETGDKYWKLTYYECTGQL